MGPVSGAREDEKRLKDMVSLQQKTVGEMGLIHDKDAAVFCGKALQTTPVFHSEIADFGRPTRREVEDILKGYAEVSRMMDRTQKTPVIDYILSTLSEGLPTIRKQNSRINDDTIFALNYIFHFLKSEKDAKKRKAIVMEIAQAYTACQAVQQQTIMTLFSRLTNVELSFENQVLQTLAQYKLRTLDKVVLLLNKGVDGAVDATPTTQGPHIRNSYLLCITANSGIEIDGYDAAMSDVNRPKMTKQLEKQVVAKFCELWSAEEFVSDFVADINDVGASEHNYDVVKFAQWTGRFCDAHTDESKAIGFAPHSIFYDPDLRSEYAEPQKEADIGTKPYLSKRVGRQVLHVLGILTPFSPK